VNDDVKAAIEWLREIVRLSKRDGQHVDYVNEEALLAHIDGEPARLAAAREEAVAAREEAVAACAVEFERALAEGESFTLPGLATPLADALRDEREVSQSLREQLIAAEAERDALRAAVATADEAVRYWTEQAQHGANEAAALRAQVEAARAVAQQGVGDHYMDDIATSVLRALGPSAVARPSTHTPSASTTTTVT
jgi:multidrug resistance efflux pump